MKKVVWMAALLLLLSACTQPAPSEEDWGSFTSEEVSNGRYRAVQETVQQEGTDAVVVSIYEGDTLVFALSPARARDFWGVCWETDSDTLWTQSGDVGVQCWRHEDGQWRLDPEAERPPEIRSKYD